MSKQAIIKHIYEIEREVVDILKDLKSTKRWSWFDMLGESDGSFSLTSFIKRRKIKKNNERITALKRELNSLRHELDADHIKVPSTLSDTNLDRLFDVFIDNIFTDVYVHKDIKNTQEELEKLYHQLKDLRISLEK